MHAHFGKFSVYQHFLTKTKFHLAGVNVMKTILLNKNTFSLSKANYNKFHQIKVNQFVVLLDHNYLLRFDLFLVNFKERIWIRNDQFSKMNRHPS